jgi:DNA-binding transcriptional LysR family regulator
MEWTERIGRRIKLRDLHVLLAVAERGSMAKAAAHLAISHPVVSKTIADLEQNLGVRLFDRHSQGVELTQYGQALLQCGTAVFDEMRRGVKQIEYLANPSSGELRLGCPEIMTLGLLPDIAEAFLREHPGVQLHVSHAAAAMVQFEALRGRTVEFLIAHMSKALIEDDLVIERLADQPFLAVAGLNSQWARRRRIGLAEMVAATWVLPPYDSVPGALIAEIFRGAGLAPPRPSVSTLSGQLTAALIATGGFVGLLPGYVARFSAGRLGLKILPVTLSDQRIEIGIITVKDRTLSPLAERFLATTRRIIRSRSPSPGREAFSAASDRAGALPPQRPLRTYPV